MSTATNSGVYEVDALLEEPGFRWNVSAPYGTGVTLTYSFPASVPAYYTAGSIGDFHAFDDAWKQAARDMLAKYAQITNLTFVEVPDSMGGQMRFAFNRQESGGYATPPYGWSDGQSDSGGDVWISSTYAGTAPGTANKLLLHEIGHALGLKHPGRYTMFASNADDSGPFLPTAIDNTDYTVMSYNAGSTTVTDLAPLDKQAIQFLYGAKSPATIGNLRYGDDGANALTGGGGYDYLHGMGGNDTMLGGAGDDMLGGEDGNDWLQGDDGADLLAANKGLDTLLGGGGADTLYGGQGEDTMAGGTENDLLYGNMAGDTIDGGDGFDTIYGGQGDDVISGGAGNDYLFGNIGNDTLVGNAGREALNGGPGNDLLVGGDGNDIFRFDSGSGTDTVTNFRTSQDFIIVTTNANGMGFASGADVYARVTNGASGAVVDLGGGNSVTILGVQKSQLAAWNFAVWDNGWN